MLNHPPVESQFQSLAHLNSVVQTCQLCPRLRRYSLLVAHRKKRQFAGWEYWGKPLPGFGDPQASLLILGLAPAAHGGNRTGRMFTGDGSAQFLMRALHRFGFASQPTSESAGDGLKLRNAYMTAIVRCAPPENKPTSQEIKRCMRYWTLELKFLGKVRIVLALGRLAFDTYVRYLRSQGLETECLEFRHGVLYRLPEPYPAVCASYHPSRQNTQTGRLTVGMFDQVFQQIRRFLASNAI